jgi:hypothetical protein
VLLSEGRTVLEDALSRARRTAAISFSPPAPAVPEEKATEEVPAAPEPDKLLAVACRRLENGSYLVFTVSRLNGVVVEEPYGRPAESHLIAADRLTDAVLSLGGKL